MTDKAQNNPVATQTRYPLLTIYAQGDVLIRRLSDKEAAKLDTSKEIGRDPDNAVVLQHGEVTGHRHAFYGGATMFRDDALARSGNVPSDLYVGHFKVETDVTALLKHEEHDTIAFKPGVYEVRRQQEFPMRESKRIVAD